MSVIGDVVKGVGSIFGLSDDPTKAGKQFTNLSGDVPTVAFNASTPQNDFRSTVPTNLFQANAPVNDFQANQADVQTSNYADAIRASQLAATTGQGAAGEQAAQGLGGLAKTYADIAAGGGPPSLAQQQLQTATQQNAAMAAGALGSVRGLNPAMAARQIIQAQTAGAANAANQGAQLRSQEQFAGLANEGNALQAQAGIETAGRNQAGSVLGTAGGLQNTQSGQAIQNLNNAQSINAETARANQSANLTAQELAQRTGAQNAQLDLGSQALNQQTGAQNVQANLTAQQMNEQAALANTQANLEAHRINAGIDSQNAQISGQQQGGLISGGAAAAAALLSDERVKTDIKRSEEEVIPGVHEASFKFLGDDQKMRGVIAQDVERAGYGELISRDRQGYRHVPPALAAVPMYAMGGGVSGPLQATTGMADYNLHLQPIQTPAMKFTKKSGSAEPTPAENTPSPTAMTQQGSPYSPAFPGAEPLLTGGEPGMGGNYQGNVAPPAAPPLLFHGGAVDMTAGGRVPGHPKFPGHDTRKNDTQPGMLSPKEIVLPLSVAQAPDAGDRAKAFVEAIKRRDAAQNGGSYGRAYALSRRAS